MGKSNGLAKHTAEIKYVFGNLRPSDCYDDIDMSLSKLIQDAWIAFARTRAPHGLNGEPWPAYTVESELSLIIDASPHSARISDEPIVRLIHLLRTVRP
jgi:para-nitrobenzyl esterase